MKTSENCGNEATCHTDGDVLVIRLTGIPEIEDVIKILERCYGSQSFRHALWDYSQASMSGLSADLIASVTVAGAPFTEKRGPNAKTALLVANDRDRLAARAFTQRMMTETTVLFDVFLDEDAARAWLAAPV